MKRPIRTIVRSAAVIGVIAVPATAAGQSPQAVPVSTAQGQFSASGAGTVVLDGDAAAIGLVRGPALIVVEDRVGDVKVRVGGRLIRPARTVPVSPFLTVRRYRLATGQRRFLISGTGMRARIQSGALALSAAGVIRVRLRGQGSYTVDNGAPQAWPAKGQIRVGVDGTRPAARAAR